jgi:DsbC/DsbD-like thiol-disulfide interchange protein
MPGKGGFLRLQAIEARKWFQGRQGRSPCLQTVPRELKGRSVRYAALLAVTLFPGSASAQRVESADVVRASVKADKPDSEGKQTATITLVIEKGWHLYANPVGTDLLKSVQTTVKFIGKVSDVKIDYPAGRVQRVPGVGGFRVYEGKVAIKATVRRAKGDASPLQLSVRIQAADSRRNLFPSTLNLGQLTAE